MVKTVKLSEFSEQIESITEAQIPMAKAATRAGIMRSIPELVRASPVDTGRYASSWDMFETEDSIGVGNTAPHAPIIEFGARPFTPPIGPLLAWAKRVLQDPSQPPNYSDKVWALAKGVQNKIQREGMKPRHVLTGMIDRIIENIRLEFDAIK